MNVFYEKVVLAYPEDGLNPTVARLAKHKRKHGEATGGEAVPNDL